MKPFVLQLRSQHTHTHTLEMQNNLFWSHHQQRKIHWHSTRIVRKHPNFIQHAPSTTLSTAGWGVCFCSWNRERKGSQEIHICDPFCVVWKPPLSWEYLFTRHWSTHTYIRWIHMEYTSFRNPFSHLGKYLFESCSMTFVHMSNSCPHPHTHKHTHTNTQEHTGLIFLLPVPSGVYK